LIDHHKPSLSVCVFGAGLAHAAALVLIVPILITLPAPADTAPQTVAIHVEIRAAASESIAQGDAEEAPLDALPSEDVTAALPAPAEPEEPAEAMEPTPQDALGPEAEPEPDEAAAPVAVANVAAEQELAVVPVPLRRPSMSEAMQERPPVKAKAGVAPREHTAVNRSPARAPAKSVSKGFLGGHMARPMREYPF